jgi:hypothetical protein
MLYEASIAALSLMIGAFIAALRLLRRQHTRRT